jgi:hypothetical protein
MSDESYQAPTYGNITPPGKQGFWGLSLGVLGIAGFLLFMVMIATIVTQYIAAGVLALLAIAVVIASVFKDKSDRTIYQRGVIRMFFRSRERRGDTILVQGPAGRAPDGRTRLPGLLAPSELSEHVDSYGHRFGLIRLRGVKHYTVVLEVVPDGDALVDAERVDSMVAHWGAWLAALGESGDIVGASVSVETSEETGQRLERMVNGKLDETASDYARDVAKSLPEEIRANTPMVSTRIAITFSGRGFDKEGSDQGLQAMAAEIGARLPILMVDLGSTGAGSGVRACTAQDIVDHARAAYDPIVAPAIEQARADGGTGLTWADAGPVFQREHIDRYYHDRAVSKTWEMHVPPTGTFRSSSLGAVLRPVSGVLRKRVTLLYRPVWDKDAVDAVGKEGSNAEMVNSAKSTAAQRRRLRAARQSEEELQDGAGLLLFGLLVTATTTNTAEFARLDKVIPGLTSRAGRLRMREALGNQAVAFQAGLPLGVVPMAHAPLGQFIQEWI